MQIVRHIENQVIYFVRIVLDDFPSTEELCAME